MRFARRVGVLLAIGLVLLAAACAEKSIRTRSTPDLANGDRDLIVLLPDPDSGKVGSVKVSNAFGSVDLARARAATLVPRNQAPSPVTTLSEPEMSRAIGSAFDALPPAPQHFILRFQFDSDQLTAESLALLPNIMQTVKNRRVPEVLIVGHTDTTGPAARNVALGLMRATIIRTLLIGKGLDASLIETDSHGESDLLVPTADNVAEPRNRRVEIAVR